MQEPDVTITDFLLSLEALAFALLIARSATTPLQRWFTIFFVATAVASLAGGLVHGFFSDSKILWRLVLIALGVVATAAWAIGSRMLFSDRVAYFITIAASIAFVAYVLIIAFLSDAFAVAIVNYLPATVFLILAFVTAYRGNAAMPLALGLGGLVLTLVAAGVQQSGIALHPKYFNHNALYHLLQAIALFLIFWGAVFLTSLDRLIPKTPTP
ncbi:MAG TPA: hypothetical protein VF456_04160 [Vicinamibacterales bacterium]